MAQAERPHRFNLMLSLEEYAMLTEIAEGRGLAFADVLRQLLREDHRAFVESQARPKAKTATKGRR